MNSFDEQQWLAWAEQQRSRQIGVSGLEPVLARRANAIIDADQVSAIHRGVLELHRRNSSLCEQLLSHYRVTGGVTGGATGEPRLNSSRPTRYGTYKPPPNPRVEVAKRWVAEWTHENAH